MRRLVLSITLRFRSCRALEQLVIRQYDALVAAEASSTCPVCSESIAAP